MYLYLIPRITDYYSTDVNYFNVPYEAFYLDQTEKDRIITFLKMEGIISITSVIKVLDPIIKRFIINVFIRRYEDVTEDNIREQVINTLSSYFSSYDRYDRVVKSDLISQLKNVDGIDSVNLEFVGKDNEDYHKDGALLSSNQQNVLQSTYATSSNSVNVSSNNYRTVVVAQQNQTQASVNQSVSSANISMSEPLVLDRKGTQDSTISVGNSTIVSYQNTTQNDPKKLVGIDPVLGDIVIGKNEIIILRGGWSNRNGVFFSEDPKTTTGFSTVNIIWKGVTPRS